jgi:hypothetical protein
MQLIDDRSGEAFLRLRLKDQAASLKLLEEDPNLRGLQLVGGAGGLGGGGPTFWGGA